MKGNQETLTNLTFQCRREENQIPATISSELGCQTTSLPSLEPDFPPLEEFDDCIHRSTNLFDSISDAVIAKSVDGTITQWNSAAERMFGYSAGEIIGRHVQVLFPVDRRAEAEEILVRTRQGEYIPSFETIRQRKDGNALEVAVTISPIKNERGQIIGASKIIRDLTEYNRCKRQLEEQSILLEKTRDAIIIYDLTGRILFWNKAAERVYGWPWPEVSNRLIGDLIFPNAQRLKEINSHTLDKGEWSGELHQLAKNGQEIIVESHLSIFRDNDGLPRSILAVNTDVTDKRNLEIQFMRAQRMESLGILSGGIAHDLNNILTPIMLSIDMLKCLASDGHSKSILNTIENSTRRGSAIVQQVLSFARGMEGQRIFIEPKYLLKDIEHIIVDTFPSDICLDTILPSDTWTILGEPTQVQQVLLNLCLNARDAMPNGGTLSISAENCVINEEYVAINPQAKAGSYVVISVRDAGMGIPNEIIGKIFEPFFTTKEIGKGTGLGLSSAKAIVKSHDGFISVYSELGRGTTFRVHFPAQEAPREVPRPERQETTLPRGKGEMILVVDDEASILSITSETLQTFGYKVLTAGNGAEAVAVYAQRKDEIAIILTDLSMPVMDGRATSHALLKINAKAKIVAMSGLDETESIAKASQAGIKHFISKPYTAGILLKTLHEICEAREA